MKKKNIAKPVSPSKKNLVAVALEKSPRLSNNENLTFSFDYFYPGSFSDDDFNNCHPDMLVSINAGAKLVERMKALSTIRIKQLKGDPSHQRTINIHPVEKEEEISVINQILEKKYLLSSQFIEQLEDHYWQFGYGDGHRVFGVLVNASIFKPLFLDTNHYVSSTVCRFKKIKKKYGCKNSLTKWDETDINIYPRKEINEYINEILAGLDNKEFTPEEACEILRDLRVD